MFDQLTRTTVDTARQVTSTVTTAVPAAVSNVPATVATQVADAAGKVSALAGAAATKVSDVQIDLTDLDLSPLAALDPRRLATVPRPKVDLPKVDLPSGFERVADVVRDTAYAGLGAAVIAAQQVDAGVRRLTSRAA